MFSTPGTYPAVGLFSVGHLISVGLCLILIAVVVILTKNMSRQRYMNLLKLFAIIFTGLELFKIAWSFSVGYVYTDAWVPLYFCSLFIFALWCLWSNKLKDYGIAFIGYAGIIAGGAFLLFPTTSFATYPLFHFQCIYSMIYHSTMVYSGIMALKTKSLNVNLKTAKRYICFCLIFMFVAFSINLNQGSNLMFLTHPYRIPIPLLKVIHNYSYLLYLSIIVAAHLAFPFVYIGICAIIKLFTRHKVEIEDFDFEEAEHRN